jgi:hypothetical protein
VGHYIGAYGQNGRGLNRPLVRAKRNRLHSEANRFWAYADDIIGSGSRGARHAMGVGAMDDEIGWGENAPTCIGHNGGMRRLFDKPELRYLGLRVYACSTVARAGRSMPFASTVL